MENSDSSLVNLINKQNNKHLRISKRKQSKGNDIHQ